MRAAAGSFFLLVVLTFPFLVIVPFSRAAFTPPLISNLRALFVVFTIVCVFVFVWGVVLWCTYRVMSKLDQATRKGM